MGAIARDNPAELSRELRLGADPNALAPSGRSILSIACDSRAGFCALALIKAGALPEGSEIDHRRFEQPLRLAIRGGRADVTRALIAAGARVDLVNENGRSLLACCADTPQLATLLIHAGADLNLADPRGCSALMLFCEKKNDARDPQRLAVIELMIRKGAHLLWANDQGERALDYAFFYDNEPAIDLLSAAMERLDLMESTPLARAAAKAPRI